MPYYIVLWSWTDQGIRTIKEGAKRAEATVAAVEKLGGKIVGRYITFGQYDGVLIAEFPNDEVATLFVLGVGSRGDYRTITLKATPMEEAVKIIEKLP